MRALLISDIHSNLEALEAVLSAAPEFDVVWNLGDVVGYGANPNEVIDMARQLAGGAGSVPGGVVVRGNHDRACAGLTNLDDFSLLATHAVQWTQAHLSDERRDWLRNLPAGPISPGASEAICVHGSPSDEDEYLLSAEDVIHAAYATEARITFFGHTHRQGGFARIEEEWVEIRPIYGSEEEAEAYEMHLRAGVRYVLNPGSSGQPRDGDWRAAFAIYDLEREVFTWHRVPYALETAQEKIRQAGLPNSLADRLGVGR
jgi:diadenosine tetraphosphatase ApaH/serine/threonine PP2A family protein phosphatase